MNAERKPTTVDLLVIIASTAIGLGLCIAFDRQYWRDQIPAPPPPPRAVPTEPIGADDGAPSEFTEEIGLRVYHYFGCFTILCAAWTPSLLCMRLRRPRRPMRDLVGCFGASATVTATVILFVHTASFALQTISTWPLTREFNFDWAGVVPGLGATIGPGILASWHLGSSHSCCRDDLRS
jgi:hypothetical protein